MISPDGIPAQLRIAGYAAGRSGRSGNKEKESWTTVDWVKSELAEEILFCRK